MLKGVFRTKEKAAPDPLKALPASDRKAVEEVKRKYRKNDGVPRTAQQSIPFERMFPDGICRVRAGYYTKTLEFKDINYQLAQPEDKKAIFEEYCSFLNFFDSSVSFQLSFMNMSTDVVKNVKHAITELDRSKIEEQTAAYSVEIWKRFRKWGGIPTGITQNVKDLLSSAEVENIFENSDFILMLNQAAGDREILAKKLGISPSQLSFVKQSGEGAGLLFYGGVILPFADRFPKDLELYRIMTTKLSEIQEAKEESAVV